jgi:Fic family protein
MSLWMKGRFYIQKSIRSFIKRVKLTNQELILESLDHINKQNELMNRLTKKEELLYTKPGLSYEDIAPFERNNLLKFKNGYTIKELVENYSGDGIVLLQHVMKWLRTNTLLSNEEYEKRLKGVQDLESMSGFKKMMNKIMGTGDDEAEENEAKEDALSIEEEILKDVSKKDQLFNNQELLKHFLTSLETHSE